MANIDTSKWASFKINSLFTVKRPAARSQSNYEAGSVPFVASGNYNNGVLKYLTPKPDEPLEKGNCISVSPIDGSAFYQGEDFLGRGGAGSSVILLYNDKLNPYNGYFIATVIRAACRKYSYGDMANKDLIAAEQIKLPAGEDHQPDFFYMESYMKARELSARKALDKLLAAERFTKPKSLDTSSWKPYLMRDLFEAKNTDSILLREISGAGITPYVTASSVNNGVAAYIDASKYSLVDGNCILVGGKTFSLTYQQDGFVSNDSHNFTLRIKGRPVSIKVYLFLLSALRAAFAYKYHWSDAVTKDKLLSETILLPAAPDGPDYAYMEAYMEAVEHKSCSSLSKMRAL